MCNSKTLITAYHLLDFNTFGVAYQEIDFNTDTVFSKTSQSRNCITWTTCEIWDYFCTNCESESQEWTYSCGAYSTHEACDFIDAGDSSTGGGTSSNSSAPFINNGSQWDNTFCSTGSGGETSNTGNDPNTDNPSYNNEPCIQDANGNCIGDATSPKTKTPQVVPTDPCDELEKLGTDDKIKDSYDYIQDKVNSSKEYGYSFTLGSEPVENQLANNNAVHMSVPHGGLIYGYSHTHPNITDIRNRIYPMFSTPDLYKLGLIAAFHSNPGTPKDYNLFFATMTVKNNGIGSALTETYAIKISNMISFLQFLNNYGSMSKRNKKRYNRKLNDKYNEESENGGGNVSSNYLKVLFKFLEAENISGIDMYKATNETLTQWKKISYDSDNNIINSEPCN